MKILKDKSRQYKGNAYFKYKVNIPVGAISRAQLYKEALEEFPNTRENDIKCMKKYLSPKDGERILEIGAGSGFFSQHILDLIGEKGRLIVSDPSLEQLEAVKKLNKKNIDVIQFVQFGSETVNLE